MGPHRARRGAPYKRGPLFRRCFEFFCGFELEVGPSR
jgi:hypothetical protein